MVIGNCELRIANCFPTPLIHREEKIVTFLQQIIRVIEKKLSNQFARNLGWLGMAEISYRLLRLGLVVIIARFLTPRDYGLGAIILMTREFAITFSNIGIGAKIIQAEEEELEVLCNSAYWLNWLVFTSMFVLQCLIAFPISWVRHTPELLLPIGVSGLVYLVWPIAGIQKTLIQRENRFKIIAMTDTLQYSLSTILCAVLAFLGMGVWAFALPPILAAPIEFVIYSRNHSWRPTQKYTTKYWNEIWNFGRNILGVGLLKTLRNNLDYLILFMYVSDEELGMYFFGFNAGLGISLSIINAINSAIFPHLCAARREASDFKERYFNSLRTISFIIIPFVLLQSSLATFYVPIVFGQKWIPAIPIVILVCLSAIPRPFADAATQLLVAVGRPDLDLRWNVIFTSIFGVFLFVGVQWHIIGVAASVLLAHLICLPLFSLWAIRYVFSKYTNPNPLT